MPLGYLTVNQVAGGMNSIIVLLSSVAFGFAALISERWKIAWLKVGTWLYDALLHCYCWNNH